MTVIFFFIFCIVYTHSMGKDSSAMCSIPTLGMVRFWSLGNFSYPDLSRYTQLQMSNNIVGKVPAMD